MKTNLWFLFLIALIQINLKAQTESLIDIDGNIYSTIKIGKQVWMAENLKTTKFNDSTVIPLVNNLSVWAKLYQPAYCWYNNDEITNKNLYGALYNWFAVQTGKLCPTGWHVPSDKVWLAKAYLPCGFRDENGIYMLVINTSYYWTSTERSTSEAYHTSVLWDGSEVIRDFAGKNCGFSVRCIKNEK